MVNIKDLGAFMMGLNPFFWGTPNLWMVYFMANPENPMDWDDENGVPPILGNLHLSIGWFQENIYSKHQEISHKILLQTWGAPPGNGWNR